MRLLVTGVHGFIGSHVAREALRRGWQVFGVARTDAGRERIEDLGTGLEVLRGDLTDAGFCSQAAALKPDACVHAAWFARPGEYLASPENLQSLQATLNLAQALHKGGCRRLVGVGTCFEYAPSESPLPESAALGPASLYASSKVAASSTLELFDAGSSMRTVWARLFYLYGPWEAPLRLVPSVIGSLLAGERAAVTEGRQVRDYLYVEDAASALADLAAGDLTGPVNVGSGVAVTVREVVSAIGDIVGRPELVDYGARPENATDPPYLVADVSKLRGTGWTPRYDLRWGLVQTVGWWRQTGMPQRPSR